LRLCGSELLQQIENSPCERPAIWWLGHSSFVLKYRSSIFYIDPYLSDSLSPSRPRLTEPPVRPDRITHASLVLCTHAHADHLDPGTVPAILEASRRAKLVTAAPTRRRLTRSQLAEALFGLAQYAQSQGWSAEELLRAEARKRERAWRKREKQLARYQARQEAKIAYVPRP